MIIFVYNLHLLSTKFDILLYKVTINIENIGIKKMGEYSELTGVVKHIIWERANRDDDSRFCVLSVKLDNNKSIKVVYNGSYDNVISIEKPYTFSGTWEMDKKFGEQFKSTYFEASRPQNIHEIFSALKSGLIKGVGPILAKRIVDKFGNETFQIMDSDIDRLLDVKGITPKKLNKIKQSYDLNNSEKKSMVFMTGHGISPAVAKRIYTKYKENTIDTLKTNPYILAEEVYGIGFQKADIIAIHMGFDLDSPFRIVSGILFAMKRDVENGNIYSSLEDIRKNAFQILSVKEANFSITDEMLQTGIKNAVKEKRIIIDDDRYYLKHLYYEEVYIANKLTHILNNKLNTWNLSKRNLEKISYGFQYDDVQQEAIRQACKSKILIITGGPGTGKTTVLNGILDEFDLKHKPYLLAAPTGKAAKRMYEATGRPAKTIHRLLEYNKSGAFQRNEDNPLDGSILVIDESSMIDNSLLYSLLKAVPERMKIIFIGDADQLPSVRAGNVLNDMIESKTIPVIKLKYIHRQNEDSLIVQNAHLVNNCQPPINNNKIDSDFFVFYENNDPVGAITFYIKNTLLGYHKYTTNDIQVLAPMKKNSTGTVNLNRELQALMNPPSEEKKEIEVGGIEKITYRVGDKVMQAVNNYEKDVFNGDSGIIKKIDTRNRILYVEIDDRIIEYDTSEIDEIMPSYAITIHKSQGSEYPVIIIPVCMESYYMLSKNLLYTGITRGKEMVVLIGEKRAIELAVTKINHENRKTWLKNRLIEKN